MECPACLSDLPPLATACRACGRNVAGELYVLNRLEELRTLVDELREQVEAKVAGSGPDPAREPIPQMQSEPMEQATRCVPTRVALLRYALTPGLLLLMAHHLLVYSFDLGPVWLMLATLVLPVPFGVQALLRSDRGSLFWTVAFLVVVILTIMAMNLDLPLSQRDPNSVVQIFPTTPAEWVQEGEFTAGLFFSFLSGLLSGLLILRSLFPHHPQLRASRAGMMLAARRLRIASSAGSIEKFAKYLNSLGAIASAVGAVYLAIRRV